MTLDDLRALGADVDDAMARFMNNEGFYLTLVSKVLSDNKFEKLRDEFDAKDTESAFRTAHDLKGILANLSLTPLLAPVAELTELLRGGGEVNDDQGLLDAMFCQLEKFRAVI